MENLNNLLSVNSKVILFTGGYGYLATPCVKYLAQQGARVYVLARNKNRYEESFVNTKNVFFECCDVSDELSVKKAIDNVYSNESKIDVIVNNAVYLKGQSPENMTEDDFTFGLDGTLTSIFRGIKHTIPYFKKQGYGKIINVSSMYGMVSPDFSVYDETPEYLNPPHYGAAKAGVLQLTKYYAAYLGKWNIQVNAITPGPFPSNKVQEDGQKFVNKLAEKTAVKRIGNPVDLIGSIVLLSSAGSDFITGQNIVIDGGWTIV